MFYFYLFLFSFSIVMFFFSLLHGSWDKAAAYLALGGFSWIGLCSGVIWSQVDFGIGDGIEWILLGE